MTPRPWPRQVGAEGFHTAQPIRTAAFDQGVDLMKKTITCILVADGSAARFFRNDGPGKGLQPMSKFNMDGDHLKAQDIQSDKPGRTFDSAGAGRHAMAYPTDPQKLAEQRFLEDVLAQLQRVDEEISFDRLVIAAAPRALGEIRQMISESLKKKVVAELDKDLTKHPVKSLPKHFEDVIML